MHIARQEKPRLITPGQVERRHQDRNQIAALTVTSQIAQLFLIVLLNDNNHGSQIRFDGFTFAAGIPHCDGCHHQTEL